MATSRSTRCRCLHKTRCRGKQRVGDHMSPPVVQREGNIMRGSTRTSRIAAYVASGALVVSGTVLAATPAEAATHDPIGVNQGATWLAEPADRRPDARAELRWARRLRPDRRHSVSPSSAVGGHGRTEPSHDISDALADRRRRLRRQPLEGPRPTPARLAKSPPCVGRSAAATTFGGANLVTQLEASVARLEARSRAGSRTPAHARRPFDDDSRTPSGRPRGARADERRLHREAPL